MFVQLALAFVVVADPAPVAATVNGESISRAQVDAWIRRHLPVQPAAVAPPRELRAAALEALIEDLLLKQFLEKNAPPVDSAELDRQLAAFTTSLRTKGQTLARFLEETRQTEAELRESWAILMRLDGYVRKTATEADLKAYHAENRDHFDGVEVNASHILIRVGSKATPVERAAAKEKLEALKKDIVAGKLEFAAAAKKHSQCPSALDGGALGFLPRKNGPMDEAFSKAAFALKPGETSPVVESEMGLHLIRVTERKPGKTSEYAKCVDEVREAYADDRRPILVAIFRMESKIEIAK